MKNKIITYLFLLLSLHLFAVDKAVTVNGRVSSIKDDSPIPYAIILLVETGQWTMADENGLFAFENLTLEKFSLEIRHLGLQKYHESYLLEDVIHDTIDIHLLSQSYDMEEIIVTAEKGQGMSTTSIIDNVAIQHVQPTTLGDVMQLLPGNLIDNPNLSERQNVSMREIGTDANSASGTAIIMDGTPIDNDANFQTFSTTQMLTIASSVSESTASFGNSVGEGIDLRQIPTDNIESIEVITGIPSVTYGNLTSGAVVVKTKSGHTPYEIKVKTDPKIKQFYVGKGIRLKKGDAVNFNLDYTRSFKDLRSKYQGFDRITAQLAYSKTFLADNMPLSFNTKLAWFNTIDEIKTDPDALVTKELYRASESGGRFNIYGQWALNKSYITNLEYNISTSITQQENYREKFRSGAIEKISLSMEEGENYGIYLPSESLTKLSIKGLPINIFTQLTATKNIPLDNGIVNNIIVGGEYRLSGNYGKGRIYDITNPPTVSRNSSRPRSYKDIPSLRTVTVYAENKFTWPIASTTLDLQGGVRINNFQPTNLFKGDVGTFFEPRFNARYKIIDNTQSTFSKLTIRGGIGLTYKRPPLIYLHPDLAYIDLVSLDHFSSKTTLLTTKIFDTTNPDLKPSKNYKREVGLDFKIDRVSGSITAYHELLTDGFGMLNDFHFIEYRYFDVEGLILAEGEIPDIATLPVENRTWKTSPLQPVNNKKSEKTGVEYSINFGKIKPLLTSISLNGAWMRTQRVKSTVNYDKLPTNTLGSGQHDYIAVYPAGATLLLERLNSTVRFITHSPRLRLIFTTTMQMIWYEKKQNLFYDEIPIRLYNQDETIEFTEKMATSPAYLDYVSKRKAPSDPHFKAETFPPLLLCNINMSKELGNNIKLSLYANNFLNHRPMYQYQYTGSYTRRNPSIYFGAEIKIKL